VNDACRHITKNSTSIDAWRHSVQSESPTLSSLRVSLYSVWEFHSVQSESLTLSSLRVLLCSVWESHFVLRSVWESHIVQSENFTLFSVSLTLSSVRVYSVQCESFTLFSVRVSLCPSLRPSSFNRTKYTSKQIASAWHYAGTRMSLLIISIIIIIIIIQQ